jgi:hypothetical protein
MPFFVFICLSVMLIAFLIMIAIQLIRVEKMVTLLSEQTEAKVKFLFGKSRL